MSNNSDKLECLSKMMDDMEKENEEKFFKEGDQQAGQRLAELAGFRQMMGTSCNHNWESDGTGHYYCTKCGADGGSAWDC